MELFHESVLQLRPVLELEDSRTIGVKIRQAGPEEVRLDIAASLDVGRIVILRIEDEQERTPGTAQLPKSTGHSRYRLEPVSGCI